MKPNDAIELLLEEYTRHDQLNQWPKSKISQAKVVYSAADELCNKSYTAVVTQNLADSNHVKPETADKVNRQYRDHVIKTAAMVFRMLCEIEG